ncbi:hypothetical protein NM208_g14066 [Fusarium decemcellulare]|uniref:Uncharacterized protein n=1 Tax=Fusarium decemcellulare TaxID=57161 RepID=A0ACC1RIX6_9HYPO|nr:hypothetical protein NM208_g14066 [Fusarium decemcellulare]
MTTIRFPKCTGPYPSADDQYRQLFSDRLLEDDFELSYEGYLRAIQLYGNEFAIVLQSPVKNANFTAWIREHPLLIAEYHKRARAQGYNPKSGQSKPLEGLYYPNGVPKTSKPAGNDDELPEIIEVMSDGTDPNQINGQQNTQLAAHSNKPATLRGMTGSRVPLAGDFGSTCVGGMEMAVVVTELLERVIESESPNEWIDTIKETLEYIGGSENMTAFLNTMYEKFPKKEDNNTKAASIGRQLRGL